MLIIKVIGWACLGSTGLMVAIRLFSANKIQYLFSQPDDWVYQITKLSKDSSLEDINTFLNYITLQTRPDYSYLYIGIIGAILLSIVY